jgi:hypothetical protein
VLCLVLLLIFITVELQVIYDDWRWLPPLLPPLLLLRLLLRLLLLQVIIIRWLLTHMWLKVQRLLLLSQLLLVLPAWCARMMLLATVQPLQQLANRPDVFVYIV